MLPKLSIIIVNYNTRGILYDCLKTVFENISLAREVFVVDNHSIDGSADMVAKEFHKVNLIRNQQNLGYNAANNQALQKVVGDYILILNSDTLITHGSIETMVRYLKSHSDVGLCGPQIINLDGKTELSAFPLPNFLDSIQEGIFTYTIPKNRFLSKLIFRRRFLPAVNHQQITKVGWVSGAAVMIKKSVFDLIGPKDINLYSYAEEADWGIKVRALGFKTVYFPKAQIIHLGSMSSNKTWDLKCARVESSYRERLYFARKYFSQPAIYFLRICLLFELWLKILFRSIFTWPEPKRSLYLETYLKALDNLCEIENNISRKIRNNKFEIRNKF